MNGTTLGAYRLVAEVGSGGMGRVWRADVVGRAPGVEVGCAVALKIVHPHLLETPGFFKRFLREAEVGRAVQHVNVVRTLDADEIVADGVRHHVLVMEYVEGRTLRALADELGRVPEELCRHVGREVARGLAAIHEAGAVHRDLKPDNVLITPDHAVKVMDLGIARLADEAVRLSQTGAFVGSLHYAAPECFKRELGPPDHRADLHALGLVLYELATGDAPYAAPDVAGSIRRVLEDTPRRAGEVNPQLSPFFEEFVSRLLRKDPRERIQTAAEAARILDEGESSAWWRERARVVRAETRRPLRRIRIPRETAVYGRETEIAQLRSLYERAAAGEGIAALIEGEAGIGKSRLVDELVGRLQQQGEDVNFLFGSYPPGGAATASGAFSTAYSEHFGGDEDAVRAALPQTPLLVPAFTALLSGDAAPAGAAPLTKDSLHTLFVHATRALAAERTTIVLVDDLHFAPDEGRALFAALALAVPGHRILLVGTTRPGLDEKWLASMDRSGVARVFVPRLGPKDLVRMLADALRSERLAEELGAKIALKSDGNPFFAFEFLRGLRDGRFITRREDGTWATTRVIDDLQIPSSVLDLVQARVADIAREERNALDVASCLGFEFDPSIVAAALGVARVPLLQSLAHVEKKHRLVRSAGRRFQFDHHQVQEALYGGLPEMLREEYHAAIAAAMETSTGAAAKEPADVDGALCVDLAEHFLKGAQGERAKRWLDAALTHLEKGYLNDAAVRLAERALAVPGLVTSGPRAQLLLRLAQLCNRLGRQVAERTALDEALRLADAGSNPALRANVRVSLGSCLLNESLMPEAETVLREAVEIARSAADGSAEARASGMLGSVLIKLARHAEARERHEAQLAIALTLNDRRQEASAYGSLGLLAWTVGRLGEARKRLEQHRALAVEIGDRAGEARAVEYLGFIGISTGSADESRACFERALAISRQTGDRRREVSSLGNLSNACYALDLCGDALTYGERSVELSREIGDRGMEALGLGNVGQFLFVVGRTSAARQATERSLELCRATGELWHVGSAHHGLGLLASEAGDTTAASRHFEDALAVQRSIGYAEGMVGTLIELGVERRRGGDDASARTTLEEALATARSGGFTAMAALAAAYLACLPGGDAKAAVDALPAVPRFADEHRVRFVLWQATGDRTHLTEAKRRLDFLVEHAPPADREAMIRNVRLHREITEAAKEAGV